MGSDWEEVCLSEVCKIRRGSSPRPIVNFISETDGMPWVKIADATQNNSRFITKTKQFLKEEGVCKSVIVEKGDLILSNSGTAGLPKFMSITACIHDGWQVLKDLNGISKEYLYYTLIFIRIYLLHNAYDSVMKNLTLDMVRDAKIKLPPLPEQKAIAHILGSLDDKIELNRQMNQTLEAMAQALFKSWFVDFDPVIDNALAAGNAIPDVFAKRAEARTPSPPAPLPEVEGSNNNPPLPSGEGLGVRELFPSEFEYTEEMGWIPKGWGVGKLNKLIDVKYGKDHKKLDEGTIPVYGSGGVMRYVDQSLYKGESVLIPRKGTLSNLMYVDEEFWSVDTMFYSVPKIENIMKFIFYYLKTFDFVSMNVGSAVPSMTTKVLNDINSLIPDENILKELDRLIADYFNKKQSIDKNSNTLESIRDTLLPKLLSGELRIPEAEKLVSEVY